MRELDRTKQFDGDDEKWLTTSEASQILGISTAGVRKRIDAGTLESRKVERPNKGKPYYLVRVPLSSPSEEDKGETVSSQVAVLNAEITFKNELIADLRKKVTALEEKSSEADRLIGENKQLERYVHEQKELIDKLISKKPWWKL